VTTRDKAMFVWGMVAGQLVGLVVMIVAVLVR